MGLTYRFRDLVHYHHGEKHGRLQAGMVQEELRVLHPDWKAAERDCMLNWAWLSIGDFKACPHCDMVLPIRPHLL